MKRSYLIYYGLFLFLKINDGSSFQWIFFENQICNYITSFRLLNQNNKTNVINDQLCKDQQSIISSPINSYECNNNIQDEKALNCNLKSHRELFLKVSKI